MTETRRDLASITLSVVAICGLTFASFWTMRPFLGAAIWATMIVVASWPALLKLQSWFGNRRWPAVLVMSVGILLLLVIPFTAAVATIAENAGRFTAWVASIATNGLPTAPEWVAKLPMVGDRLAARWDDIAASGAGGLMPRIQPYAAGTLEWLLAQLGNVGRALVQFLIMLGVATLLYANGETALAGVRAFCVRLMGERGHTVVHLAGQAIRGVALGVVISGLGQAALSGIGLAAAGVPYAVVLAVVIFILCVIQIGPLPVLLSAVVWRYATGGSGWAVALLVWSLGLVAANYFVQPYLMKKGADLPILLIITGVLGGLLSFGLLGIFVGPVVLAVAYTLTESWVRGHESIKESHEVA